jgi:hypothetical protein
MKLLAGMFFPNMAPAEIKALAENNPNDIRVRNFAAATNLGKAVFYNGADNIYRDIDSSKKRIAERMRFIEAREANPLAEE